MEMQTQLLVNLQNDQRESRLETQNQLQLGTLAARDLDQQLASDRSHEAGQVRPDRRGNRLDDDRERIGYIPQQFVLYPRLSVAENLLRSEDGANITADHIRAIANWMAFEQPAS